MPNKIEKLPDGKFNIELETGEKFNGDPLEVTEQLAKSQQETKRWAQQIKAENEALKAAHPATPPNGQQPPPADPQEKQLQDYLLTQVGKGLGYDNADQFKADLTKVKSSTEEIAKSTALQTFFTNHPEYPGTEAANDTIGKIFDEFGWKDLTAEHLHLAHLEAVNRHQKDPKSGYQPLSEKEISESWAGRMAQANRQAAPPMLRGNSPDANSGYDDPYKVPMEKLRQDAIKQELERR
jgi:hypothetical protein